MSSRPGIPLLMPRTVTDSAFVDDKGRLSEHVKRFLTQLPTAQAGKIRSRFTDTHAERLKHRASEFAEGTLWKESDTGVTYISDGTNWEHHAGILYTTQDSLPVLAKSDAGFEVLVSDYNHHLLWDGAAWGWAPGDNGSGYTASFLIDPGVGWQVCDGTAGVATLLSDGTLDFSVTVPTQAGLWYRR